MGLKKYCFVYCIVNGDLFGLYKYCISDDWRSWIFGENVFCDKNNHGIVAIVQNITW